MTESEADELRRHDLAVEAIGGAMRALVSKLGRPRELVTEAAMRTAWRLLTEDGLAPADVAVVLRLVVDGLEVEAGGGGEDAAPGPAARPGGGAVH